LPLIIRRAAPGDENLLAIIGTATFVETYQTIVPGRDMAAHCATRHAPAFYAAALADPEVAIFIAETEIRAPAGYAWVGRATLPENGPDPRDLELHRIYALGRYHGTGLGHTLMAHAIREAEIRDARRVVLGLHPANARALAFYTREGFAEIGRRSFRVGESCFCDFVMARPVRA
jgi:diamine N-acetyltransferase